MTRILRGFFINEQHQDDNIWRLRGPLYAEKGSLPDEWTDIQEDEQVIAAQLFSSTQRHIRGDKRKILDHFDRRGELNGGAA